MEIFMYKLPLQEKCFSLDSGFFYGENYDKIKTKRDGMNIIFLDVNGVIDSFNNNRKHIDPYGEHHFDWNCIYQLYELVKDTDSYLVVSSEWRHSKSSMKKLLQALSFFGLEERVIGKTPQRIVRNGNSSKADRGLEIESYLKKHECDNFVILDDVKWDLDRFEDHLVWTDPSEGLTERDVLKAKEILKKKKVLQK